MAPGNFFTTQLQVALAPDPKACGLTNTQRIQTNYSTCMLHFDAFCVYEVSISESPAKRIMLGRNLISHPNKKPLPAAPSKLEGNQNRPTNPPTNHVIWNLEDLGNGFIKCVRRQRTADGPPFQEASQKPPHTTRRKRHEPGISELMFHRSCLHKSFRKK